MELWLLNWTTWVLKNTHIQFEGVTYEDGPEWLELMWQTWLNSVMSTDLK